MFLKNISNSNFLKLSKQYFFVLITLFIFSQSVFSQSICNDIDPFCSGTNLTFPNVSDGSMGPPNIDYGCSGFEENPVWYYLKIGNSGPIQLQISQTNGDVDFAMWGPYSDLASGCSQVSNGDAPIQWSYSTASSENVGIGATGGSNSICSGGQTTPPLPNSGEVYIVMIINWNGSSGTISLTQQNEGAAGAGSTDCTILAPCQVGNVTINGDTEICAGQSTTIIASGGSCGTIYYQGTTNNGTSTGNSSTTQTINSPGTYYFRAYNSADDCWGDQTSITITQKPSPTNVSATVNKTEICEGESVQLHGTGTIPNRGNSIIYEAHNASDFSAWTSSYNSNNSNAWNTNYSGTNAGGTSPEIQYSGNSYSNADGRLQSPLINATGCTSVDLSFQHYLWHFSSGYPYNVEVQTSTNGTTWNTVYNISPVTSDVGPVMENIPLTGVAGNTFYIRFRVTGEDFGMFYWYIDDIVVNCVQPSNANFTWSANPGPNPNPINGANPTASPTQTTTYTLTVDNNGCSVTDQVTVVVNPDPIAGTIAGPTQVCEGDNINLTVSGNSDSGTWSSSNTSIATVNSSGQVHGISNGNVTITYTVTNSCGSDQTTYNIAVTPQVTPTFTQIAAFCEGATAPTLPTTSNNGINGTWNSTVSNSPSGTTTYTFTPATGECATTQTMDITVNPLPTVNAGADVTICEGESTTIAATGASTYSWDNGVGSGASHSVSPTSTTTYTVTGTDGNNCVNTDQVTVTVTPKVTPTFTQIAAFCEGATAPTLPTTSNNGINGTWNSTVSNSPSGTTTYTFTPYATECATTQTMDITVNPLPTVNAGADVTICEGESTTIAATGASTYSWDNGVGSGASHSVSPTTTTTYTVTGTDGNNCVNTDQVTVTVTPQVTPTFTQISAFCEGTTAPTLPTTSTNGITGTWSPATVSNTAVGNTTYTFTPYATECATTQTMDITVNPLPTIAVTITDPTTCGGNGSIDFTFTNVADGTYTIGGFTGVIVTGGTATINTPAGTYSGLSITNQDGCISNIESATLTDPNAPDAPTFTVTDPTCTTDGFAVVSNYLSGATYTFTPVGPSVGTTGEITGASFVQNYNVEVEINGCTASASFQIEEQLASPAVPSFTVTDPTCTTVGSAQIDAYDNTLTYTIAPNTATIDASGEITGTAATYTVTVENGDGCQNTAQVVIGEELADPTIAVAITDPTTCGGNGSIDFTFTNVADGTYTIGGFTGVVVT